MYRFMSIFKAQRALKFFDTYIFNGCSGLCGPMAMKCLSKPRERHMLRLNLSAPRPGNRDRNKPLEFGRPLTKPTNTISCSYYSITNRGQFLGLTAWSKEKQTISRVCELLPVSKL